MFFFEVSGLFNNLMDEEDDVLGPEPVSKFLPSVRLKSRNNVVLKTPDLTRMMFPDSITFLQRRKPE